MKAVGLLAVLALSAQAAFGQQGAPDKLGTCASASGNAAIEACTALIDSGKLAGADLALALVARGDAFEAAAQYDKAIQDYTKAIALDPASAPAHFGLGWAYEDSNRAEQAAAEFQKGAELFGKAQHDETMGEARYWCAIQFDDSAYGRAACTRLIVSGKLNGRPLARIYAARADHAATMGSHEKALQDLEQSLALAPDNIGARVGAVEESCLTGDYQKAVGYADDVLTYQPNEALVMHLRGDAKVRLGKKAEGKAEIAAAEKLDPQVVEARCQKWEPPPPPACWKPSAEEMIAACTAIIDAKTEKDLLSAYELRADAYGSIGQFAKAAADYSAAIALIESRKLDDHALWDDLMNRAEALCRAGECAKAIPDADRAIAIQGDVGAYDLRGWLNYRVQQYDRAVADFSKALELDPQAVDALIGRGKAYYRLSRFDEALKDLDAVIAAKADTEGVARRYRALIRAERGQGAEAIQELDQMIAEMEKPGAGATPNDQYARAFHTRGMIKKKMGDEAGGTADIAKALSLDPTAAND